jgi:O-acetyl-ADP-ribose deacetylase (regulator of RNase III)
MTEVAYHLRDRNPQMVAAWCKFFAEAAPEVQISEGNIFGATADAIVSPANSFGYMDGGIDLAYVERFGWELQDRLQAKLREEHDGELPVGCAIVVSTGAADIPFMISAPTMRIPSDVSDSVNAYLAYRAAIRAVRAHNQSAEIPITSVLCPGLATSIGQMPHRKAAQQMLLAYLTCARGRTDYTDRTHKIVYNHTAMLSGQPIRCK